MLQLTQQALIEFGVNFIFYFTIGCFGAFLKDLYETLTRKNDPIRFGEVLIGGACAAFICLGLQDTSWFKSFSLNLMVLITFLCGILGFELFGNFTTITKFKRVITMIIQFKNRVHIDWTNTSSPGGEEEPPPRPKKRTPRKTTKKEKEE